VRGLFLQPIGVKEERNGPPSANQGIQLNPDLTMLFLPWGWTHTSYLDQPFLLMQNLSPKDITRSNITRWKYAVCRGLYLDEVWGWG